MFTDCPSCRTQFRLRAVQLSAAAGLVQCGFCGCQFNALDRLHDRPIFLAADAPNTDVDAPEPADEEPWFDISDSGSDEAKLRVRTGDDDRSAELPPETTESFAEVRQERSGYDGIVPPEQLPEEALRSGRRLRFVWLTGSLLLLLALPSQLAWFHRDRLLQEYPRLLPWARQVCEYFQCELIRHRDLDSIDVINRDVRDHPRYRDALLVNATISNRAEYVQPFPAVQLNLYNTVGEVIAYRRFRPDEYLDESINIESGMFPGQPVHIVLEVTGTTEGAVSFEFHFLHQE